jgi:hypothetical protein
MNLFIRHLIIFLIFSIVGCTVQKRIYRQGWTIQWNNKFTTADIDPPSESDQNYAVSQADSFALQPKSSNDQEQLITICSENNLVPILVPLEKNTVCITENTTHEKVSSEATVVKKSRLLKPHTLKDTLYESVVLSVFVIGVCLVSIFLLIHFPVLSFSTVLLLFVGGLLTGFMTWLAIWLFSHKAFAALSKQKKWEDVRNFVLLFGTFAAICITAFYLLAVKHLD